MVDTCFVEHEKKTFFSWLGDTRSEDGGQGRCSCAFIEAKRRPLTVAAAKGTRAKRVLKPFSLGPLFSTCLRRGAQEPFLRFQMDTCVNGACAKLLISRMLTFVDIRSALRRSTVTQLGMTCQPESAAQAAPRALQGCRGSPFSIRRKLSMAAKSPRAVRGKHLRTPNLRNRNGSHSLGTM